MTAVQDVLAVLERSGFERLPKPLTIVGTEFDFEAAARGTQTSHDLVLIATDRLSRTRLQRLVAGLARSLDIAESRRPVSLVLLGGVTGADRHELDRYARVLPIASSDPGIAEIEEAIAVLLPLELPTVNLTRQRNPVDEAIAALAPGSASPEHIGLLQVAADGTEAVREALRQYVNEGAGWFDRTENDDE